MNIPKNCSECPYIERTYKLEGQVAECQHDIKDLKAYHKPTN